jgi:hypothetical protein
MTLSDDIYAPRGLAAMHHLALPRFNREHQAIEGSGFTTEQVGIH